MASKVASTAGWQSPAGVRWRASGGRGEAQRGVGGQAGEYLVVGGAVAASCPQFSAQGCAAGPGPRDPVGAVVTVPFRPTTCTQSPLPRHRARMVRSWPAVSATPSSGGRRGKTDVEFARRRLRQPAAPAYVVPSSSSPAPLHRAPGAPSLIIPAWPLLCWRRSGRHSAASGNQLRTRPVERMILPAKSGRPLRSVLAL
jgi:hypothetical protein